MQRGEEASGCVSGGTEGRSITALGSVLGRDSGQPLLLEGVVWAPAGEALSAGSLVRGHRWRGQRSSQRAQTQEVRMEGVKFFFCSWRLHR